MRDKFISRRHAIAITAAGLIAAPAIVRADAPYKKSLNMQSLNSGEKLKIDYYADGDYLSSSLKEIDWFMRDLRTNEATRMSTELLDLLQEIASNYASTSPIYTMSGYRSPKTNAKLASNSEAVDPTSFHMRGMAIDITQNFSDPGMTYRIAKKIGRGGVGFYPTKNPFVHIDVGPHDTWIFPQHGREGRAAEYDRAQIKNQKS